MIAQSCFLVAYNDDDGPYAVAFSTLDLAQAFAERVIGDHFTIVHATIDDHIDLALAEVSQ